MDRNPEDSISVEQQEIISRYFIRPDKILALSLELLENIKCGFN